MRQFLYLLILLCMAKAASAQVLFQNHYYVPSIKNLFIPNNDIIPSPDNNGYFALSALGTQSDSGIVLFRTANNGSIQWSNYYKIVPSSFTTSGFNLLALSDSTLLVNGYDIGNTLTIKLDLAGNLISAYRLNSLQASTIYAEREVNGAVYGVGRFSSGGFNGALFCKRDLAGNAIWARQINGGTSKRIELTCLTPTADGGFLLAGHRQIYNSTVTRDPILIKTDSIGNIVWQKQIHYSNLFIAPYQVEQVADGGFLFSMNAAIGSRALFIKTDSIGNVLWNYSYEYSLNNKLAFRDFYTTPEGNFITCGTTSNFPESVVTFTIDSAGSLLNAGKFYTDTVDIPTFFYNSNGLVMLNYKVSGFNLWYSILNTDSAFNSACGDTSFVLTPVVNTLSDSTISLVSVPVTLSTSNVTPSVIVSNLPLSPINICPVVYTQLPETTNAFPITYSPVPALNEVTFSNMNSLQKTLRIYDVSGKTISCVNFTSSTYTFDARTIQRGIYFFELTDANASTKGKLIFQ